MTDYEALIQRFSMIPHEEGGYYAEVGRKLTVRGEEFPLSHIHYLWKQKEKARWHRVASDEIWLFHCGSPLTLYLGGNGDRPSHAPNVVVIGEAVFHCLIPGGTWQSAEAKEGMALVSCIVSPGFQQEHWELLSKENL